MRSILLLAALLAAPALHAQKVTLTPFPAPGSFTMTTVQDMTMEISLASPDSAVQAEAADVQQQMESVQTTDASLTVTCQGTATHIVLVNDRTRMEVRSGEMEMSYDSDDPEAGGFPVTNEALWIGKPIEFRYEGDSIQVMGLDSLIQTIVVGGDSVTQETQRMAYSEMFKEMIGAQFDMLPESPVGLGESFDVDVAIPIAGMGAMQMVGTWTVSRLDGSQATFGGPFTMNGEMTAPGMPFQMTMTGQGTSETSMDTATGEQESTTDMVMEAVMDMGAFSGGQVEGVMTMTMSMTLIQTMTRR